MTDNQTSARQQRLRAALRENLKRRKGQIRGRAAGAVDVAESAGPQAKTGDNRTDDHPDIGEVEPKSAGPR